MDSRAPPSLSDSARLDGQRLYDLNRSLERHYSLTRLSTCPPSFCFANFNERKEGRQHCHWRWCYLQEAKGHHSYYRPFSSDAYTALIVLWMRKNRTSHPLFLRLPSNLLIFAWFHSLTRCGETGSFHETGDGACRPVSLVRCSTGRAQSPSVQRPGPPVVPLVPKNNAN